MKIFKVLHEYLFAFNTTLLKNHNTDSFSSARVSVKYQGLLDKPK